MYRLMKVMFEKEIGKVVLRWPYGIRSVPLYTRYIYSPLVTSILCWDVYVESITTSESFYISDYLAPPFALLPVAGTSRLAIPSQSFFHDIQVSN